MRALQFRRARGDQIVCGRLLCVARVARQRLFRSRPLAFGHLEQAARKAAPRTFEATLLLLRFRQSRALLHESRDEPDGEIRLRSAAVRKLTSRHFDQRAAEAHARRSPDRRAANWRAARPDEHAERNVDAAFHRCTLIPGPSARASAAAALASSRRCPAGAGRCRRLRAAESRAAAPASTALDSVEVLAEPLPRGGERRCDKRLIMSRDGCACREQQQLQVLPAHQLLLPP